MRGVPRLWTATIEEHKRTVRDAVLDAAAALVAEHGLTGVTMSAIAGTAGIGRATLYTYFPDVDAVLLAWHERQIRAHLTRLVAVRDRSPDPWDRVREVLTTYVQLSRRHVQHGSHPVAEGNQPESHAQLARSLHRGPHVIDARDELVGFVAELLADAADAGAVRDDVPAAELAQYALHALDAAGTVTSGAAAGRLAAVVLDGLR